MDKLKEHFGKWCVWRFGAPRKGDGKPSKIPMNLNTGVFASSGDDSTFGTYDQAFARFEGGAYHGLGVLMRSGPGVVCVDVDDCIDVDGTITDEGAWAFATFSGYCEVSQSGKGLHFFMLGERGADWATKVKPGAQSLEIYDRSSTRYICVTGDERYRKAEIIDEQAALDRFAAHFGFANTVGVQPDASNPDSSRVQEAGPDSDDAETHSDEEILALLRKHHKKGKIKRLWDGDTSGYSGDHSSADMALLAEIAFYTCDPAQVERIFGESALAQRARWKRKAYRDRSIEKALTSCKGYHWHKGR